MSTQTNVLNQPLEDTGAPSTPVKNIPNPLYFSPSMSAKLVGVSERSIRRAIKSGEIKYDVYHARYQIELSDLIHWSELFPNRSHKRDTEGLGQYIKEWNI